MYKVKLTTPNPDWPLERQTPGESGIWGNCQFFINRDVEECDYWVVLDDLPGSQVSQCQPQNTLLITAEPPSVKTYAPKYLRQFGAVLTCNRQIKTAHVIYSHSSLPWHVGRRSRGHQNLGFSKNYDELSGMQTFEKKKLISVITSGKTFTRGHRQRIAFVNQLKQHFGSRLDVFGRGINEIEDKWDAIADYRYHIALENCRYPDYWTEKLSDAYLGGAVPLYYGCPNLSDYFSATSFIPITYEFTSAVAIIEKTLSQDHYEDLIPAVLQARRLVLNTYNLFPRLHEFINQFASSGLKTQVMLQPASLCTSPVIKAGNKIRRIIQRYL